MHECICACVCMCVHVLECQWKTGFSFGVKARTGRAAMLLSLAIGAQRTPLPMIHSNPGFGQSRCRPCQPSDLRPFCPGVPEHDVLSEAASLFSLLKAEPSSDYKNGSGLKFKRTCGKNLVDCHSVGTKMR